MSRTQRILADFRRRLPLAGAALRWWGPRQWTVAAASALAMALLLGFATVLIPNDVFSRDIPSVPWNYPVWLATSVLTGMLAASYIRPVLPATPGTPGIPEPTDHTSRWGMTGGLLAWFAIGCPVCNKIALLTLGYSGAITYFAPLQPWLAALAMVLTVLALVFRLSGQQQCAVPGRRATAWERKSS
ncbi:hypothetical protein DQ353_12170 [Arthrobacter sp. AQ5-05]|uniref:hypothetical protein n=1 Tax=Arthrobacter sp. AQ5-05 TaxID=2184581 RepID=UPI000DCF5DE0|nr:hypothetical protein [Arthrobacter sp. AQ5-05]RAX49074.1 hypothetical protein DQ353_12170 [Arthrobacter sp. AQ5-05]